MAEVRAERRLAAIVVTDIVGYSKLIGSDESGTLSAIRSLKAVIDPLVAEHKGRIFKTMGDGAVMEFTSVVDAVACATAIQRSVTAHQAGISPGRQLVLRIGINLGDVVVEGEDLFGDGVNVAARLEQLCPPGGILISGTTYDHLRGKLDIAFDYMGKQRVKNISEPVRIYRNAGSAKRLTRKMDLRKFFAPGSIVLALLLLIAATSPWWWRPAEEPVHRASVAVLPFDNIGGDEPTKRLADGITEDIITDLSRFPDFDVIARNSTAIYAGKPADIHEVANHLHVRYVLEGSVQRNDDQIRVTAQLIDAESGAHIWAEKWDRHASDVFAVQTEIVQEATNRLGGSGVIMEAENRAAKRKRPESLSAYEKYLLGRDRILTPTKERLDEAIALFKEALAQDPKLARAWVDLAWAYNQMGDYGADYAVTHPLALNAARRAVDIDPMDAGAHAVLGILLGLDGDFARAKSELDNALRLNPGSADILTMYAGWSSTFGDPDAGAEMADRALRMNPSYPPAQSGFFYFAYFMAGRCQDALTILKKEPIEGRSRGGWALLASCTAALGMKDEAKTAVSETLTRYPDFTAEGFANEPGFNPTERQKLADGLRNAGFPLCAPKEKLAGITKPFRLPECVTAVAP